jgi:hypothetical protein
LLTLNVCEDPGSTLPVSKVLPSSAVAVCAVLSWLLTVTPASGLTVTLAGANLKSLIFTVLAEPRAFAEAAGSLSPPQPASSSAVPAMTVSEQMAWRGFTAISVRS